MSQIFDKELRARVHNSIGGAFDPARTRAYIEVLEEIVKTTIAAWDELQDDGHVSNETLTDLEQSFDTVDWMRE